MAGFGGAVKLTGESEYRQAIRNITQDLSTMSGALRAQASDFANSDKSIRSSAEAQKLMDAAIASQQQALDRAKTALAQYSVALQAQQTRHNALSKEYRNAIQELDRIEKESGETSEAYKRQAEVVDKLGQELADSTESMDASKAAMKNLRKEIGDAEKTADSAAKGMDDLGEETEDAGKSADEAGEGFTVFKGILADLSSRVIVAAFNGLKKLGGKLIDVGKQAYYGFAEYEQLVGGVETLFGESADKVKAYAENAYKTAGLSANEYMEQVTSFSATLLQGLNGDTARAADVANIAMIDMSDNANKMGTSMSSIQNAYQGFAKQNYTMLDNLKLGYGGTQAEMARLINDSGVLGGTIKVTAQTVKEVPFDKIIEAIHKTQQQIGITGTTAEEAAGTIEGSTKSVQASWQNVLVAIADENQDLTGKLRIFTDNVVTMAKNSVPRIKQVVVGMAEGIKTILYEFAPGLADAVVPFFEGVMEKASNLVGFVKDNSGEIINVLKLVGATLVGIKAASVLYDASIATANFFGVAADGSKILADLSNTMGRFGKSALIIAGVTAAIGLLIAQSSQLTADTVLRGKEIDDLTKKVEDNKKSWEDLKGSRRDALNKEMTEHQHLEDLYNELKDITYQNGLVKEGYEERAKYITGELSQAMDIEIKYYDGIIEDYQKIQGEIDKWMEKRKAQIQLENQETLYKEASEKQAEAIKTLNELEEKHKEALAAKNQFEEDYANAQIKRQEALEMAAMNANDENVRYWDNQIRKMDENRAATEQQVADTEKAYNEQNNILKEYAFKKSQYENNMALFTAGKYSEMSTASWEYVKDLENAGDAHMRELKAEEKEIEDYIAWYKTLTDDSGEYIYKSEIEAAERRLKKKQEEMRQYEVYVSNGMKEVELEWKSGITAQLDIITGGNLKFKNAGKGNVQAYINEQKVGEPMAKANMAHLIDQVIKEISMRDTDSREAAEDLIRGINNGIGNKNLQSSCFKTINGFAGKLLSQLKSSLKEQSPSKATAEMGGFLVEGLPVGIKQKEGGVMKQVTDFGRNILGALDTSLQDGVTFGGIAFPDVPSQSKMAAANAGDSMVDALVDALTRVKIELDDEVAGHFVERTVTRVIYA